MGSRRGEEENVRIAGIDLGTNTALLLVADVSPGGLITKIWEEQAIPRIGKEVDKSGSLNEAAFTVVASIFRAYKERAEELRAGSIVACGTSALRDASNSKSLIDFVDAETGIRIGIISGDEEAELTFRGAASGLAKDGPSPLVLDIGGGSTEISWQGELSLSRFSLEIGSVRITERLFLHTPPLEEEVARARDIIASELSRLAGESLPPRRLVGVAGTATTLACFDMELREYDSTRVAGYTMDASRISAWADRLCRMTPENILLLSNAARGRADILPAGALILNGFMTMFRYDAMTVSDRGLRYGIVLREWERLKG
jgi:exopolyphosphatase/guanosine-5'-triphosphate,3'-diphosphate pyrophosphatase